ncbi:putative Phosphogluconate dehydrogenase NAD-binding putative C-terminal domain-containing protein [Seiridium cardinale]
MSFGEMGMGIASLLTRYSYPVVTNLDGRSENTLHRAKSLDVKVLPLDEMLDKASIFLSIVPPAESPTLAKRVAEAYNQSGRLMPPLTYIDLNAISPDMCKKIGEIITPSGITFIDGAIIGFPPKELGDETWFRPSITMSGPSISDIAGPWTTQLISLLNIRQVGDTIGDASCLKMCFGGIYKGHTAIFIQAYTTAHRMGVLEPLRQHMAEYFPGVTAVHESSMYGSQRKAYRWIKEMEEVQSTFGNYGGWGLELFTGVGDVFRLLAKETDLEKNSRHTVNDITDEICKPLIHKTSNGS